MRAFRAAVDAGDMAAVEALPAEAGERAVRADPAGGRGDPGPTDAEEPDRAL
ncbi:hypothetical protein [Nocardiopsis sp. FIRDI 009]|uniref:hypothetical protein n=1 Tax=Nocardiopsis sp. FIRDI 009 TaxID=714197 RepID=UPI0013009341|nr:hypothetical protein [Nocardiopsis sp. FIRDI 009]